MRIYNGAYELMPGIKFYSPNRLYEYSFTENKIVIHAIIEQGNIPEKVHGRILSYTISSPFPDALRIQIRHLQPRQMIKFDTLNCLSPLELKDTPESLMITSGQLGIKFEKEKWAYSFFTDSVLSESSYESAGIVFDHNNKEYITEKLSLGVGELVYGLGERFSPFVRNGQSVVIRNSDPATESDLGYKNIPFYMTNRGYGIFINTPAFADFEICTEDVHAVRMSVPLNELDYFIFYGPRPKSIINHYTHVTGRPPLIPKWSLGLWLTTSFTTEYSEKVITEQIDEMFRRKIPLSVFHFDCYWMKERHWCNFLWDTDSFPDPKGMISRLKKKGLKICLWINPYISELSEIFDEAAEQGFFIRNAQGGVYQQDWWQPGLAMIDFTNPGACEWYKDKLRTLLDVGVDTFKTDFGESAPVDGIYYSGVDGSQIHNYYTYLYNKTVFELLTRYFGENNTIVFARSATTGSQKFPVHWGGDSQARYTSMYGQLRGGLSFGISGCALWSHDIGGFYEKPRADIYKRWIAFGLLSSHSRLHGNDSFRVPWNFDEESCDVLRHFSELKSRLIPYLYGLCYEASVTGLPLMRPMLMEFPDDPGVDYLDRQYMLGPSLLVAPVFTTGGEVTFYLPKGTWTNFLTGRKVQGGQWISETHDFFSLPLYVRENSIIPTGPAGQDAFSTGCKNTLLTLYNIKTSAQCYLYDDKEILVTVQKKDDGIRIDVSDTISGLMIKIHGSVESIHCEKRTLFIRSENMSIEE
ncbi:MAG: alpha-xylosidase [Spirochaetales bacterium]|nr:alpha-xylosidase [Spirochaetales bacterium]